MIVDSPFAQCNKQFTYAATGTCRDLAVVAIPLLNSDDNNSCEGLSTVVECKHAIISMQKNKAPGFDGISVEFYQVFWADLNHILVYALNERYANESMLCTQR